MGLLDSYQRQDSKRQLSIDEKLEAIRRVTDFGETKASVSRMYGVPESTLRGWCKNRDKLQLLSANSQRSTSDSRRKTEKKDVHYEGLLMPVQTPRSPETKKIKLEIEMKGFPERQREASPPVAHSNALSISPMAYDLPRLFAMYCAQADSQRFFKHPLIDFDVYQDVKYQFRTAVQNLRAQLAQPMDINSDEPLSLVKKARDSSDSRSSDSNVPEYSDVDETAAEAIRHGEQFLQWLEGVSDPSITRLQLLQFRCLLDKVKTASFPRQYKSGPVQIA